MCILTIFFSVNNVALIRISSSSVVFNGDVFLGVRVGVQVANMKKNLNILVTSIKNLVSNYQLDITFLNIVYHKMRF